ncbi:MAG: alpha/beta hydrolase [Rhodospirillum sp.]|nr:alpha/beta hydrolase [Rhodospirillum sp.]
MISPENQARLASWRKAAGPLGAILLGQSEQPWDDARADYLHALDGLFPPPEGVTFETVDMDGVSTMRVTPDDMIDGKVLFYIHGGGYVHGGSLAYRGLAGRYAKALKARVYVPDYRQAPEYPYPTPIADTFQAYRSLFGEGLDPAKVTISGDSAGGAMVVTIMRMARDAGVPLPAAGVAISPWADLTHSSKSQFERDGLDPICSREFLMLLARNFLGQTLPSDPDASPVYADVRGLPPVLIQIGENEVMLSDAMRLAAHLGENRVRTSLEVWPGMFHVWHLFGGMPEADEALRNAVFFLEDAMQKIAAV